ncbi:hypothetical protein MSG28_015870 [Choristoneura fumiferana]|uniref:Uncharacterized protein n=1 Tax=Choristoneura fumiferana TaxID=7141 RepID=A0ACC0K4M2_CHOFU|nr:hypothetical protein MSG28_015870 [Choristoneura fumiferana]
MDDLEKHASSYRQDQEILDARGINMTVEEVAGLPTVKYSEKVLSLQLIGVTNSRRRSLEHLRRLTRELRAARARRDDALAERRALLRERDAARDRCRLLRAHCSKVLNERSDPSPIPDIDALESHAPSKEPIRNPPDSPALSESYRDDTFECRLGKLVQKSVNHIFDKKKVSAKTVFLEDSGDGVGCKGEFDGGMECKREFDDGVGCKREFDDGVGCKREFDGGVKLEDSGAFDGVLKEENGGVLDLCIKEKRRSHGRKQSAPRRIAYVADYNDVVLDLKIKKENQ